MSLFVSLSLSLSPLPLSLFSLFLSSSFSLSPVHTPAYVFTCFVGMYYQPRYIVCTYIYRNIHCMHCRQYIVCTYIYKHMLLQLHLRRICLGSRRLAVRIPVVSKGFMYVMENVAMLSSKVDSICIVREIN
jgi:hypothetical protein